MTQPASKRDRVVVGGIFVAAGLGIMAMMAVSPDGLDVPYWVGMVAAATFAFAGASVTAQGLGWERVGHLLGVAAVLCLAAPGLWILFDPAEKHCSASIGLLGVSVTSGAGDFVCRALFGFGGALTLAVAAAAFVAFIRVVGRRPKGGDAMSLKRSGDDVEHEDALP